MDFRNNSLSIVEKLHETLKKNFHAKILESDRVLTDYIVFTVSEWSSARTQSLFKYCGITDTTWVTEWQVTPVSTKNVKVILWLKPTLSKCEHNFVYRENWAMHVCQLCGIMMKRDPKL